MLLFVCSNTYCNTSHWQVGCSDVRHNAANIRHCTKKTSGVSTTVVTILKNIKGFTLPWVTRMWVVLTTGPWHSCVCGRKVANWGQSCLVDKCLRGCEAQPCADISVASEVSFSVTADAYFDWIWSTGPFIHWLCLCSAALASVHIITCVLPLSFRPLFRETIHDV